VIKIKAIEDITDNTYANVLYLIDTGTEIKIITSGI
jgi:hypothetical protein